MNRNQILSHKGDKNIYLIKFSTYSITIAWISAASPAIVENHSRLQFFLADNFQVHNRPRMAIRRDSETTAITNKFDYIKYDLSEKGGGAKFKH
jgi:hypothetical protein